MGRRSMASWFCSAPETEPWDPLPPIRRGPPRPRPSTEGSRWATSPGTGARCGGRRIHGRCRPVPRRQHGSLHGRGNARVPVRVSDVAIGRLNADAIPDLAVVSTNLNSVLILLGTGGGTFSPYVSYPVAPTGPVAVALGDMDGDGALDIVAAGARGSSRARSPSCAGREAEPSIRRAFTRSAPLRARSCSRMSI